MKDLEEAAREQAAIKVRTDSEYISSLDDNNYLDENGYILSKDEFWENHKNWNEGWSIKS